MKVFIFGGYSIGDKIMLDSLKNTLNVDSEYLGEKVDLSKINPEQHNLIIIINRNIANLDIQEIMAYVKKDLTKPLMVVSKLKTFGALFLGQNMVIENIATNKIFPFDGILYVPKEYMRDRMSSIFRDTKKEDMRFYITPKKR